MNIHYAVSKVGILVNIEGGSVFIKNKINKPLLHQQNQFLLQQYDKPALGAWMINWWPSSSVWFPCTFCEALGMPSAVFRYSEWRSQEQPWRGVCWWPGQQFSAEKRRKLLDKKQCSLFKKLWRHHMWRKVKLWTSWRRRRDAMTTAKSQRFRDHLENSCDFLDCWVQDEVARVSGKRYSWVTDEVSGELGNGQRSRATAELW